jgi:cell division protein FtsB
LNETITTLAFHEMRLHATAVLIEDMKQCLSQISKKCHGEKENAQIKGMTNNLKERLALLRTEQRAILLEVTRNQKVAQNQLEIVYNLVAQRDNEKTHEMAEIQRDIAASTMNDSFAMRTIAVMSIAFLPGTFVSSFFSISIFDWQAPAGSSVLSPRFWIYWAVTLPLTLVVFAIWFTWQHHHQQRDHQDNVEIVNIGSVAPDDLPRDSLPVRKLSEVRSWFEKRRHKAEPEDEEQHVEITASGRSVVAPNALETTLSNRAPTAQILRTDTSVPAPRIF